MRRTTAAHSDEQFDFPMWWDFSSAVSEDNHPTQQAFLAQHRVSRSRSVLRGNYALAALLIYRTIARILQMLRKANTQKLPLLAAIHKLFHESKVSFKSSLRTLLIVNGSPLVTILLEQFQRNFLLTLRTQNTHLEPMSSILVAGDPGNVGDRTLYTTLISLS